MAMPSYEPPPRVGRRYLRAPVPVHFPTSEQVPESRRHEKTRHLLAAIIEHALGENGLVCSDQFLYWDADDPRRCLAPDVCFRAGAPRDLVTSWKTWERGAPHVGVEIVSEGDRWGPPFKKKLERYRQTGVLEVVRYDWDDTENPIRIWDRVDGDLTERDRNDPEAFRCDSLGWYWCQRLDPELGLTLRLARNRDGTDLVLTPVEAALAAKDDALAAKDDALAAKDDALAAKDAALARVAELEAALAAKR